jgi:glycosyltransferase involved in cell wall biosynthesis
MSNWLFIGPTPLSGIGQVMTQYAKKFGTFIEFGTKLETSWDYIVVFLLPVDQYVSTSRIYRKFARRKFYIMSICETYPVHDSYGHMFKEFTNVITPSAFCRDVFFHQFGVSAEIVPLYQDVNPVPSEPETPPYVFYTIGNLADPRKNIKMLLECFIRCNFGNKAKLLLKATCRDEFKVNLPNVEVINEGILSDEEMERRVHQKSHCYINCSHSEGVGMGAVEAALRNKPVIITDFGGLKEYVKTPFTIPCKYVQIGEGAAEFLFTPDMFWGQPDKNKLIEFMTTCFTEKITKQEHPSTKLKLLEATRFFCRDECSTSQKLD